MLTLVLVGLASNDAAYGQVIQNQAISLFVEGRRQKTTAWTVWNFDSNCDVIRDFSLRVDRLPQNGEAWVERTDGIVAMETLNHNFDATARERFRKCQGRSVPVLRVYYRARPNFTGFDNFKIVRVSASRKNEQHVEVRVAVR